LSNVIVEFVGRIRVMRNTVNTAVLKYA